MAQAKQYGNRQQPLIDNALLERLERLSIQWQKSLPGLVGGHNTSRFAGAGQEFLDHRHFHHGDDLRAVNWRAFMRLDKMYLKIFQLEPRIPVRILVDVSRSMLTGESGSDSKFDYVRRMAGALAYIGLMRLDSICIQPFSDKLHDSMVFGGGRQKIRPALNFLERLEPQGGTNFFQVTRDFLSKFPQRGVVIIISDFLQEGDCEKPLQYLADFGHELILLQVFADEDRQPPWDGELDLEDAETGTRVQLAFDDEARANYVAAFDEYSQHLRTVALRNGGRYLGVSTSIPLEEAIFGPLVRSGAVI